jgi:hypothetical protein
MQARHNNQRTCCRYAREYALASHVTDPVSIRERQLLPAV